MRNRQAFILIHYMQSKDMFYPTTDITSSIEAVDLLVSKDKRKLCSKDTALMKDIFIAGPITLDTLQALPSNTPLTMRLLNIPIPQAIIEFYGATFMSKLNIMAHTVFERWTYDTKNLYLHIMQFVHAFNPEKAPHLYMLEGRPLRNIFSSLYGLEVSRYMLDYVSARKAETLTHSTDKVIKAGIDGLADSMGTYDQSNPGHKP